MKCSNCGASLDPIHSVVQCAYCGSIHQVAQVVLAKSLRILTVDKGAAIAIPRGTSLPAAVSDVFSTAEDNQTAAEIQLVQGESSEAAENRHVGRFTFDSIAPLPRAKPRIRLTFSVSGDGELQIIGENLDSGRKQVYRGIILEITRKPEQNSDESGGLSGSRSGDLSDELDVELPLQITPQEAAQGGERIISSASGRRLAVKIPPGITHGTRIRLSKQGRVDSANQKQGDLYLLIKVTHVL